MIAKLRLSNHSFQESYLELTNINFTTSSCYHGAKDKASSRDDDQL